MHQPGAQKIIVIVGPTASGKSAYAVQLAKKIHGEILSADSRQIYKGLNVGSGKITKKEMRDVPHYGLDIANPKKIFTAFDFKEYGQKILNDIASRGKTPIIVGGTGFYIDTLLGNSSVTEVPPDPVLRKKMAKYSTDKLFEMLQKLNPERLKTIDKKNPHRLVRAIEIATHQKRPRASSLSSLAPARLAQDFALRSFANAKSLPASGSKPAQRLEAAHYENILWVGIKRPPEELKKRIHNRLLKRFSGIIREIKKLHRQGLSWKRMYALGLEYRYGSLYVQNKILKDEMIKKIEDESWHYAKRQMTWWKRNKNIKWKKI